MSSDTMMMKQSPLFSPKKTFHLPLYAEQMALAFVDFSCSKLKRRKDTYAQNVLEFIDGCASKHRETSDSSTNEDSATESIVT
jgi:hypothetical protein